MAITETLVLAYVSRASLVCALEALRVVSSTQTPAGLTGALWRFTACVREATQVGLQSFIRSPVLKCYV